MAHVIWIYFIVIVRFSQPFEPKQISITTADEGAVVNGVTVYRIDMVGTSVDNDVWTLVVKEQDSQFNLRVNLDQSWFVDTSLSTAITLKLHGSNIHYTNNGNDLDLLLTVQLNGQNAYYTLLIDLNNNGSNLISPSCNSHPITSMLQGDAYDDMTNNNNVNRKCNIMQNETGSCIYQQLSPSITNQWPYIFTVTNYPNSGTGYSTITYGTYTCAFNEEIFTDTNIDFWITLADPGQSIKISEIDLQSYLITTSPTTSPSLNPSVTLISTISTAYTTFKKSNNDILTTISATIFEFRGAGTQILYIAIGVGIIICICCTIVLFLCCKKYHRSKKFKEMNPDKITVTSVENVRNFTSDDDDDGRQTDEMINDYLENEGVSLTNKEIQQIMNLHGNDILTVDYEMTRMKKKDAFGTHLMNITAVNDMVIDDVVNHIEYEMIDAPEIREATPGMSDVGCRSK